MANVPNLSVVRDAGKPKKIGRYELEECLGAEGGRETYRARVRGLAGLDRVFAVKCLRRHAGPVTSRTDPFLVAAKRVGSVIDARVARVLDSDIIDGAAVVVTELIAGLDLDRFREWAQSSGELAVGTGPVAEKWQRLIAYIGGEIARALASMHVLVPPFVHGGVSPRNVIVTSRGGVKVLDAGLAIASQKGGDGGSQRAAAYAAPAPSGVDPMPAADVRALGAMLFELAVGELPPPDGTGAGYRQTLEAAWPSMAELIATMLSEVPTTRPRARQVADVLAKHWSSVPEPTIASELAALVRNFSAFVADSSPAAGVAAAPFLEAPASAPAPSRPSGMLSVGPPSAAAVASGSFLAPSDAATRVSPDAGYASAIFRALPTDSASPASPPPAKHDAGAPASAASRGSRVPTLAPGTSSKPGTLGQDLLPTLPPTPKIAAAPAVKALPPPAPRLVSAPPPGVPPSSARTVVWSPGPAQALGIAPALLARTLMSGPPPAPMASTPAASGMAAPATALAAAAEELPEVEPMAETADWGAQALAALGSQAGVPIVLATDGSEASAFAPLPGDAPPPISDPTIEEAFAFAPQQAMPDSWEAAPPASQAGQPALEAPAFASPARREMLEDELVEEEAAPLLAPSDGDAQAQVDEAQETAEPGEPAEPASLASPPLEATAFMAEEEPAVSAEPELDRSAQARPAPAVPVRRASTRSAMKSKGDLAAGELDNEAWQPPRRRGKRIVVVVAVAAALGAGAAALTLGPRGEKKRTPPASLANARAEKAPTTSVAAPVKKAPAAPGEAKATAAAAKAALTPSTGKAEQASADKPEAVARGKTAKGAPLAPAKAMAPAAATVTASAAVAGEAEKPIAEIGTGPATGALQVRIESKPAGARAWVNGQERGETPLTVPLKPGSARVVLVRPGYLTSQSTIEVRAGAALDATLKPVEPPMTGEARFRAECQTTGKLPIVVDGKETGILCPFSKMRVDPGVHTIGLLIPATGQVHEKEVTLRSGVRSVVFGD